MFSNRDLSTRNIESYHLYKRGGYHPVHLGDIFHDRYRVCRKLGWGGYSTVWLARDLSQPRYVALKIGVANPGWANHELKILDELRNDHFDRTGRRHVQQLIDNFEHVGPNGTHQCFVFEPAGRSAQQLLQDSAPVGDHVNPSLPKWSLSFSRRLARQATQGLDYLHSHRIIHRDLQPGNMLMSLNQPVDQMEESDIQPMFKGLSDESVWHPHGLWRSVLARSRFTSMFKSSIQGSDCRPDYLLEPVTISDDVRTDGSSLDFTVKISDLGAAVRFGDVHAPRALTPERLRAPEVVLDFPPDPKSDIWNLACVIYLLITRNDLFFASSDTSKDESDDALLSEMVEILGPPPPAIASAWGRWQKYFSPDWAYIEKDEDVSPCSVRGYLGADKPPDMSDQEADDFLDFLESTLRWDASERLDTKALLRLPWLTRSYDQ